VLPFLCLGPSRPQNPHLRYQLSTTTISSTTNPYPTIPSAIATGTYSNYKNPTIVSGSSSGSAAVCCHLPGQSPPPPATFCN